MTFNTLESMLYELSIRLTGHKRYYQRFFSQKPVELRTGDLILDAGCGSGLLAIALLNAYSERNGIYVNVHAFDISLPMLDFAKRFSQRSGIDHQLTLYHADAENLSSATRLSDGREFAFADSSFSLVISSGMMEYITNPEIAVRELTRVLKPGGQLAISFVRDNLLGRAISKLLRFNILQEDYLLDLLKSNGINDLRKFEVASHNPYMKALKSTYIGRKE